MIIISNNPLNLGTLYHHKNYEASSPLFAHADTSQVPIIQWKETWNDFTPDELAYFPNIVFEAPTGGAVQQGNIDIEFFRYGSTPYLIIQSFRTENEKPIGYTYTQGWETTDHRLEGVIFLVYESEQAANSVLQRIARDQPDMFAQANIEVINLMNKWHGATSEINIEVGRIMVLKFRVL